MEVAQHPGLRAICQRQQKLLPVRTVGIAFDVIDLGAELRKIPVEQEFGLDHEGFHVVGRYMVVDAVFYRHTALQRFAMKFRSEERRVGKECRSRWWPC